MTVRQLIDELTRLDEQLPVHVAGTLHSDHYELQFVMPIIATDDDHVLLLGSMDSEDE